MHRYGRLSAPAAATLLMLGCSSAEPQKVTPTASTQAQQAGEQGCYQTSWWAETSAVIYRRFDEEHRPQPAQGDNQPAAATEECP
ncbi:hypothetical protein [Pseudomonas sp. GV071]|jgi:hypothetical protein|uniref:hypothetical protein n=1 Tax=Pseudomonas sp. GV071 TaxID=2135754 RepID=UPI000D33624A|nr:hypothetical protein [Pseudomonas sp. GV071]PTQ72845.1 hypothetical protein C8K61_10252 [Pseudomonas sp. GV071]